MTKILNSKPFDLQQRKFQFAENITVYVNESPKDHLKKVLKEFFQRFRVCYHYIEAINPLGNKEL